MPTTPTPGKAGLLHPSRLRAATYLLAVTGVLGSAAGVTPNGAGASARAATRLCGGVSTTVAEPGCVLERYQVPAAVGSALGLVDAPRTDRPSPNSVLPLTTLSYPSRRSSSFLVLRIGDVLGPTGGAVGVDMSFNDPTVNGGISYRPCVNIQDPFHGACQEFDKPGYFRSASFLPGSSAPFPGGLVITNTGELPTCAPPCLHSWSQRVHRIDVEFYPKDQNGVTDARYVRSRFALVEAFSAPDSDGGSYTRDLGNLRTYGLGQPGVSRLSGRITDNGKPVVAGRFYLSAFQAGVGRYRTSGGQALQSFAISRGASDGTWTTGGVFTGRFDISVVDTSTEHRCVWSRVLIKGLTGQTDFDLSKPSFGWPGGSCT